MYERSAIVLERYFDNLLGFNKTNNLKQNYRNYCDLFEKFNIFQNANTEEFSALAEFQEAENVIEEIQEAEEKLYKKNAKLEYNRDLIFADISEKPEEMEKCITKIENDISKTHEKLIELRERFIDAVRNYNEKKSNLSKCKKNRKEAESEYNSIFEITKQNLENIGEEYIEIAKNFVTDENQEELVKVMTDNGKDEKIPFNNSVMRSTGVIAFDIIQREAEIYLEVYATAQKLVSELLEGAVSVELHQKIIRNANVKLDFLYAEKDYIVQFLDYERITVIYGKRSHRTLMQEACEKFEADVNQINNLYSLLLKEIANKSTKKAYKELYNKSYLVDIEEKDAKFKKEKNKMNMPVGTIMNSNYWRIEGIKNIYTVFYKNVSNVFGKDLVEFDLPKEQDIEEMIEKENVEDTEIQNEAQTEVQEEIQDRIQEAVFEIIEEIEKNDKVSEISEETKPNEAIENNEITENDEKAENNEVAENNEIFENNDIVESIEPVENTEIIEQNEKAKSKAKAKKSKHYTRKKVNKPEEVKIEVIQKEEIESEKNKTEKVKQGKAKKEEIKKEEVKKEKVQKEKAKQEESKNETLKQTKVKRYTRILNKNEKPLKSSVLEDNALYEVSKEELADEENEEKDIFGEKYKDIEKQIAEIDVLDELDNLDSLDNLEENTDNVEYLEDTDNVDDVEYIDEDMAYEDEDIPYEEESIFLDKENEAYEDLNLKKAVTKEKQKGKKVSIFKKIMSLNSREKKEANG